MVVLVSMAVYVLECGGFLKVGHSSKSVEARMSELQIGNPKRLRVVAVVEGGPALERRLHNELADYHVGGEWFALCVGSERLLKRYVELAGENHDTGVVTGTRVRELVARAYRELGMGANDVAKALGVPWSRLNGVLRNRMAPTREMLASLERLLPVEPLTTAQAYSSHQ
jgi:hypothetical protein